MCLISSFINSTFGCYFCFWVVQSNTKSREVRLGGQITIQDKPVPGDQKQQTKLCSDPQAAVGGVKSLQLAWVFL